MAWDCSSSMVASTAVESFSPFSVSVRGGRGASGRCGPPASHGMVVIKGLCVAAKTLTSRGCKVWVA
jgi:hypothetical protein